MHTMFETMWQREFDTHLEVAENCKNLSSDFHKICLLAVETLKNGGKIMFFGNGGSAADSQHIATEFTVRYRYNRKALPALALTTDTSAMTAISNDYEFIDLFSRQIEALGKEGDLAIGITTSGKSPNVLKALKVAHSMNIRTAAFTGGNGLEDGGYCDGVMAIPTKETSRIQEMHIMLGHMLCEYAEEVISPEKELVLR